MAAYNWEIVSNKLIDADTENKILSMTRYSQAVEKENKLNTKQIAELFNIDMEVIVILDRAWQNATTSLFTDKQLKEYVKSLGVTQ